MVRQLFAVCVVNSDADGLMKMGDAVPTRATKFVDLLKPP